MVVPSLSDDFDKAELPSGRDYVRLTPDPRG